MMDEHYDKQLRENSDAENKIESANMRGGKSVEEIVKIELDAGNGLSDTEEGYSIEKHDLSFAIKSEEDSGFVIESSILGDDDNDIISKENDFIKMEADIYEGDQDSLDIVGADDSIFSLDYADKIDKEFVSRNNSLKFSSTLNSSNKKDQKEASCFDYGNDTDSYDEEDFVNKVIIKREMNDDEEDDVKIQVTKYGRKTKKVKGHVCGICNKAFTSENRVKRHKEMVHVDGSNESKAIREGKFICKVCDKRFISQSRLNLHTVTHTGEKPFSCDVCGQKFSHPTNKRRHMKTHTGEKPFVCMFCGKSFSVKHYLTDHLVKHTGEKPHQCKLCSMTFAHRFSLKQHELLKHPGGEMNFEDSYKDRPFSCEVCGKRFTQQSSLKIHIRLHTGSKPYKCSECDASFIRSDSLLRHKFEHSGQRPFQCDMCDKAFMSGYILNKHRSIHTGDHRQSCKHCGAELASKSSLMRHMMKHSGESMLECSTCLKKFINKQSLKKHQERPCKEKIYECKECNYKSSSESKLKRHMLKHNAQKLLECKVCKNKFTYPSNLTRHMKVHEKNHQVKMKRKETIITDDNVEQFIAISVKEIEKREDVGVKNLYRNAGKRTKISMFDS